MTDKTTNRSMGCTCASCNCSVCMCGLTVTGESCCASKNSTTSNAPATTCGCSKS